MMSSALIAARSPMLALATFRFAPPRMDASDDRQKKIDAIFATGDDQDYLLNRDSLVSTEMDSSELLRRDEAADLWPAALSTDRDDQSAMLWVDELSSDLAERIWVESGGARRESVSRTNWRAARLGRGPSGCRRSATC